jgi:hypothetical protein
VIDGFFPRARTPLCARRLRRALAVGRAAGGDDASEARFWSAEAALEAVDWSETRRVIRLALQQASSPA